SPVRRLEPTCSANLRQHTTVADRLFPSTHAPCTRSYFRLVETTRNVASGVPCPLWVNLTSVPTLPIRLTYVSYMTSPVVAGPGSTLPKNGRYRKNSDDPGENADSRAVVEKERPPRVHSPRTAFNASRQLMYAWSSCCTGANSCFSATSAIAARRRRSAAIACRRARLLAAARVTRLSPTPSTVPHA